MARQPMDNLDAPPSIQEFDDAFAAQLRSRRSDYVSTSNNGQLHVRQVGGAYLSGGLAVPLTPFEVTMGRTAIETFVCRESGPVEATGNSDKLIDLWRPAAQAMYDAVTQATSTSGIEMCDPSFLTVSAVPLDQVGHQPHFDDSQLLPNEGVSLVATAATHAGTRCTSTPIVLDAVAGGLPPEVPEALQEDFETGRHPSQESAPGRILLLPQFGQLHSGPILPAPHAPDVRTLMVFRAKTTACG